MTVPDDSKTTPQRALPSALVYILPYILYLVLMQIIGWKPEYTPWLYPAGVLLVGAITVGLLYGRHLLRPHPWVLPGILVGLVGIALWILLSNLQQHYLNDHLPSWLTPKPRSSLNPFDPDTIAQPWAQWAFVVMRLAGMALLVPVAEELFWRGFLLRWLVNPDWERQPLGQFTPFSFAVVTVLFTVTHPEWLAAAVYCALLNGLMYWKRDLWNCVVAHGVSNLVLGVYILYKEAWTLW